MPATHTRIPLNLFGIPFGLTGLAGLWTAASSVLALPEAVPDVFWIIAATAWIVTLVRYLLGSRTLGTIVEDLKHPILGPFAALITVIATLFGERLHAIAPEVGQIWVLITATMSFAFGAWFISHLAAGAHELDQLHSGYFLPTVASALISAQSLAAVGYHTLALGAFGTGVLFWVLLGAVTLHRLAFRPQTPASLMPTLAIFSAPPAVAGNAWFAITGHAVHIDVVQEVIFGVFLFLIALQVLLIRTYLKVPFALGFWALTFTIAASGRYGIQFIEHASVPAASLLQWLIALLATALIAVIAVGSVRFVARSRRDLALAR